MRPLQTLANLHRRAARARLLRCAAGRLARDDALGLAMQRARRARRPAARRALARRGGRRAASRVIVESLDAAVIAVDERRVRPARQSHRRAARRPARARWPRRANDVGLARAARVDTPRTIELASPARRPRDAGRCARARSGSSGMPHELIVMTDVQHALRAEERQAWQRLVRVLGHEINNSLGPISSIAGDAAHRPLAASAPRRLRRRSRNAASR